MAVTIAAVYEDGVLKPKTKLDLPEHAEPIVTVEGEDRVSVVRRTKGMVQANLPEDVLRYIEQASIFDDDDEEDQ